ncbi:YihY/virulence factor BrkB family protein [Amnibacterium kyonggiense]|uniref:Membrane protein n=1 Tax=Amnibacterium kyonggiense TaxID=595671 RepID=A0A4R7FL22_9MICO|nr:YihY/virulence factor BrkB family protein [Amnibacterium kyonggiense]TDS77058.1 membrane protein [Amnibacterium kyonggiense]
MPTPRTQGGGGGRSGDLITAAGISVISASLVGAAAAVDHAIRRDPGKPWRRRTGPDRAGSRASTSERDVAPGSTPAPDAPSKPEGPEDLHKPTWTYALKKTAKEFGSDQCTDLAAALVYYSVLALGPAAIAIVSILGLLSPGAIAQLTTQFLAPVRTSSPGVYDIVTQLIDNASKTQGVGIGLVVGILGALWSASGYVGAFGRAMNRIYSIPEGRPVWKLRPTQLLVTVAVVVLVVLGALILVSTGPIVEQVANVIGIGQVALTVFQIVKWPILVVIAIAAIAILYYFSPNVRQPKFKWISTGSLLALVVWGLATAALGIYLSVTGGGSYAKTYGAVAGVIVFLLWLWITNLVLLFGAEFDAELERSRELQAGIAAEEQIQLPMRDTRQSDKKAKQHEQDVDQARALRQSRGRSD